MQKSRDFSRLFSHLQLHHCHHNHHQYRYCLPPISTLSHCSNHNDNDDDDRKRSYRSYSSPPSTYSGTRLLLLQRLRNTDPPPFSGHYRNFFTRAKEVKRIEINDQHSQRAVTTALWCNFLVFSLKFGVWISTSSHVMLAEMVHSIADFANQALLAYGLSSSRRAPDAIHPYGYSKERFVWSLISAVGIFCLGSGATIVHGVQNLWTAQPPDHIEYAAYVIGGSFLIEGASLIVAIHAVRKGAAGEGMKLRDYIWRGHDPTAVAVMTEDGAAVTGLAIAGASLVAVNATGNAIYDPIGSIIVGNLLGMVAIFLIQRNRHALIGRAIDDHDMEKVMHFLKNDPVVDAVYDCKSEVIGPGFFRFKAEIDFNGVMLVQNYINRVGQEAWARQSRFIPANQRPVLAHRSCPPRRSTGVAISAAARSCPSRQTIGVSRSSSPNNRRLSILLTNQSVSLPSPTNQRISSSSTSTYGSFRPTNGPSSLLSSSLINWRRHLRCCPSLSSSPNNRRLSILLAKQPVSLPSPTNRRISSSSTSTYGGTLPSLSLAR